MYNSLAPPRRPSRSTFVTLEKQASYISKLFASICSTHCHHKRSRKESQYTSLQTSMISKLCKTVPKPTTFRTKISYLDTNFQAVSDWANPRIWSCEWRGWQEWTRTGEPIPRVLFMVEISEDRWRLMFTEIICQAPTWRSGLIRLLRQLDLTIASEKGFTKICTDCGNKMMFWFYSLSPEKTSPSKVSFADIALPTKKLIWTFPYSTKIFEPFHLTSLWHL